MNQRRDKISRTITFPACIPLASGVIAAAGAAGYYLGIMIVQLFYSRVPSTWILGLFWLPFYVLKPVLIGLFLGTFVWLPLRTFCRTRALSPKEVQIVTVFIAFSFIICFSAGGLFIARTAARYSPQVNYTSGELVLDYRPAGPGMRSDAPVVWERGTAQEKASTTTLWNGTAVDIGCIDATVIISSPSGMYTRIALTSDDVSYISEVYGLPVRFLQGMPEDLAMLVKARGVVYFYVLLVVDSGGKLIYHETVKPLDAPRNLLQKVTHPDGHETLSLEINRPAYYTRQDPAKRWPFSSEGA